MNAIEVLKKIIKESKYYSKEGKYICPMDKLQLDQKKVDTFEKALLALEKQKKEDNVCNSICDVCNKETVACLVLCPDCNERKQGALEELYSLLYYCDKAQVDEKAIKRKINKRIKELEGKGVEK